MSDKQKTSSLASRRARKFGAFVEHIDKRALWEQYEGICALCFNPVKLGRTTIDHIIPLSQGGLHEYANVQPAHGLCNHVKGNGEFSLEALEQAIKRRQRRRSKRYRNKTGRAAVPLTTQMRAL